jgi:pSer/pThr/pTyr-binding forkhead associated (FHA) protein
MEKKVLIGRSDECDFVVFDPQNRVSRKHALLIKNGNQLLIEDLGSANGTFLDGRQIKPNVRVPISPQTKITLSKDYPLDQTKINFQDDDRTQILVSNQEQTIIFENSGLKVSTGEKTVVFERDKAKIEDLSRHDKSGFKTFGRGDACDFQVNFPAVSNKHMKMRLLTPVMFEIEDLGSTNGTFVDDEKLRPSKSYKFGTSAKVTLGYSLNLDLKKYFPAIIIPEKRIVTSSQRTPSAPDTKPNTSELRQFQELENVWKEYNNRLNQATSAATGYSIGGAVFGLAAAAFTGATGGIGGILLMSGGGILGRYLGQKESNKIRGDLTFEDAFLEVYACPRCKESFQKKPWVTIRECFKCKTKYR